VCPTYPKFVVVPTAVKDDLIVKSAKFRDGARFPVLSALIGKFDKDIQLNKNLKRLASKNKKSTILFCDAARLDSWKRGTSKMKRFFG
jgi:hypothetical protein